jgi:hypothetical protein
VWFGRLRVISRSCFSSSLFLQSLTLDFRLDGKRQYYSIADLRARPLREEEPL